MVCGDIVFRQQRDHRAQQLLREARLTAIAMPVKNSTRFGVSDRVVCAFFATLFARSHPPFRLHVRCQRVQSLGCLGFVSQILTISGLQAVDSAGEATNFIVKFDDVFVDNLTLRRWKGTPVPS